MLLIFLTCVGEEREAGLCPQWFFCPSLGFLAIARFAGRTWGPIPVLSCAGFGKGTQRELPLPWERKKHTAYRGVFQKIPAAVSLGDWQ